MSERYIVPEKALFLPKLLTFFFIFLEENICCRFSLEAPQREAFNEYTEHMFSWRSKKDIFLIPTFIWSYES